MTCIVFMQHVYNTIIILIINKMLIDGFEWLNGVRLIRDFKFNFCAETVDEKYYFLNSNVNFWTTTLIVTDFEYFSAKVKYSKLLNVLPSLLMWVVY